MLKPAASTDVGLVPHVCRNPGGKNDAFREISDAYEVRPAFCRYM